MNKLLHTLTIVVLLSVTSSLYGYQHSDQTLINQYLEYDIDSITDRIEKLNEQSKDAPNEIIKRGLKLIDICTYNHDNENLAKAYHYTGEAYNHASQYGEALKYYTLAKKKYQELNNNKELASIYTDISFIFWQLDNLEESQRVLTKAFNIYKYETDSIGLAQAYNNIALLKWKLGELDSALENQFKTLEIYKKIDRSRVHKAQNNIGIIYLEMKRFGDAEIYLKESLDGAEKLNSRWSIAESCNNLAELYLTTDNKKLCNQYLIRAKSIADSIQAQVLIFDNLSLRSRLLESQNNFQESLSAFKEYIRVRDQTSKSAELDQFSQIQMITEIELKETELKESFDNIKKLEEKQYVERLKQSILLLIIVLTATFAYIAIRSFKKRVKKIKRDRVKIEKQLNEQNRELTNLAIHITQRNEFLSDIKLRLKKIKKESDIKPNILEINSIISQKVEQGEELKELYKKIDKVHSKFISTLKEKFPSLTPKELKLASMLRLGLSSKEISDLQHISAKSVDMARYRLKKRMNITEGSVTQFIKDL